MTMLLNWLWLGILVALASRIVLALTGRFASPSARYVLIFGAVASVLGVPLVAAALAEVSSPATIWYAPALAPAEMVSALTSQPSTLAGRTIRVPAPPEVFTLTVFGAWLGLVVHGAIGLARAWSWMVRMRRGARPLPGERETRLLCWSRQAVVRDTVVATSGALRTPCALGFRQPMILLPEHLLDSLEDKDLDRIVLHEYAHVRRYDDWSYLAQSVLAVLVGAHPGVACLLPRLDREREMACDAWVTRVTGAPRAYARCLLTVASLSRSPDAVPLGTGAVETAVAARVRAVLRDGATCRRSCAGLAPVATAAAMVVATTVVVHLSPMLAIGSGSTTLPIAHRAPATRAPDLDPALRPAPTFEDASRPARDESVRRTAASTITVGAALPDAAPSDSEPSGPVAGPSRQQVAALAEVPPLDSGAWVVTPLSIVLPVANPTTADQPPGRPVEAVSGPDREEGEARWSGLASAGERLGLAGSRLGKKTASAGLALGSRLAGAASATGRAFAGLGRGFIP